MDDFIFPLMLNLDISSLTMSLVNIASPSGATAALADSVEAALRTVTHLDVDRIGDTVVARTDAAHSERVVVCAHMDTAVSGTDPLAFVEMGKLYGPGASDAKGALAVALKAAATPSFSRDVTFVFCADRQHSDGDEALRGADFALLAEPTDSAVVGGALDHPLAHSLVALTEREPSTGEAHGLARVASFGVPAVAFGPGDPSVAGKPGEFVPTAQLSQCEFVLRQWLS